MKIDNIQTEIELKLNHIKEGTYLRIEHDTLNHKVESQTLSLKHSSKAKGIIEVYQIFPGISLSYQCILGDDLEFHHDALRSTLEINHCHNGRIGIDMKGHQKVFLGEGDMALQPMDCCADADITLPLGFYEGIMIALDLKELCQNPPTLLSSEIAAGDLLLKKFCEKDKPVAIPASHRIDHIFCELYQVPAEYKISYMKLKMLELILFLCLLEPEEELQLNPYLSDQVEVIKQIHQTLTSDLKKRYTIEELSSEYLMNATTLKNTFKNIYGLPLASYMKKYRIDTAAARLRESNDSIACIASDIGYESQGKFTKAFKDQIGILPTDYRKQC